MEGTGNFLFGRPLSSQTFPLTLKQHNALCKIWKTVHWALLTI